MLFDIFIVFLLPVIGLIEPKGILFANLLRVLTLSFAVAAIGGIPGGGTDGPSPPIPFSGSDGLSPASSLVTFPSIILSNKLASGTTLIVKFEPQPGP